MTTASAAQAAIRARLEANRPTDVHGANARLYWPNEDTDSDDHKGLPDTPTAFIYTEVVSEKSFLAGFGGGPGANLWRNPSRIEAYVFVPRGEGLASATDLAEQVAVLFRGYRDPTTVQCFDATVYPLGDGRGIKPPGLSNTEVDNYFCAVCEVDLHFDLVG